MDDEFVMIEIIGGRHHGVAAVYPKAGELPRRILLGENSYIRFRETKCYFPDEEETDVVRPAHPPITLPLVRGSRFIP